ncbi:hypothetical protein EUZ85_00515 [Hahella sp. KA22]|uniref:hypothetical protein n=1 Tax=Hahella sp. KA22 TaxID=1628392 RepID=UPI000FDD1FC3|nr:hypothetical protein [Hahella sp. KA22]AZZ94980.1 hypothetical protein ENC22_28805 [Hahella sp. KA22]QAY52625.1 hypothetical protein EUZ85_00515 [Hahella sp. KA22]
MRKILLLISIFTLSFNFNAYAKDDKKHDLPPGLQKKVDRGGQLPPGWQKKLHKGDILDQTVYDHGVIYPDDDGVETVYVEDKIIKIIKSTREIIDILNH